MLAIVGGFRQEADVSVGSGTPAMGKGTLAMLAINQAPVFEVTEGKTNGHAADVILSA